MAHSSIQVGIHSAKPSVSSSPWLYIQSEALQDIAFHLRGMHRPPAARESPVLGRCGGDGRQRGSQDGAEPLHRVKHGGPKESIAFKRPIADEVMAPLGSRGAPSGRHLAPALFVVSRARMPSEVVVARYDADHL